MPRIAPIEISQADTGVQTTLGVVKSKIGMVPNLFATFAHSPAVLNGYLALSDTLGKGVLTAQQREIIALAVAQENECHYCLSAHTMLGKAAGLSHESIRQAREGKSESGVDNAVAALAKSIAAKRGRLPDEALAAARAAGLDDERIMEVIANVALNVLTNYANNVALTDIDFPKVDVTPRAAA